MERQDVNVEGGKWGKCDDEMGHFTPSKRPKLGQNFLADQSAAEKIVAALGDISLVRR